MYNMKMISSTHFYALKILKDASRSIVICSCKRLKSERAVNTESGGTDSLPSLFVLHIWDRTEPCPVQTFSSFSFAIRCRHCPSLRLLQQNGAKSTCKEFHPRLCCAHHTLTDESNIPFYPIPSFGQHHRLDYRVHAAACPTS